jgi:hypothetical protein
MPDFSQLLTTTQKVSIVTNPDPTSRVAAVDPTGMSCCYDVVVEYVCVAGSEWSGRSLASAHGH